MNLGIKLLVAEDDPNLGTILKAYLTQKGYTVVWAKTAKKQRPSSRKRMSMLASLT